MITLTAQEPISDVLERTITLDYDRVKIPIGRSSSKVASVAPRPDNAFYENPVMSRSHAELYVDLRYLVCHPVHSMLIRAPMTDWPYIASLRPRCPVVSWNASERHQDPTGGPTSAPGWRYIDFWSGYPARDRCDRPSSSKDWP